MIRLMGSPSGWGICCRACKCWHTGRGRAGGREGGGRMCIAYIPAGECVAFMDGELELICEGS